MFEKLFKQERGAKIDTGLDALAPERRKVVSELLRPTKERFKSTDGTLDARYFEVEKGVVAKAMEFERRENATRRSLNTNLVFFVRQFKNNWLRFSLMALVGTSVALPIGRAESKVETQKVKAKVGVEKTAPSVKVPDAYESEVDKIKHKIRQNRPIKVEAESEISTQVDKNGEFRVCGEFLEEALKTTLPSGFRAHIRAIKYQDSSMEMKATKNGQQRAAHALRDTGEIIFFKGSLASSESYILGYLLPHESAHLNDWLGSRLLSLEEKIDLFNKISGRLRDPNCFKSGYLKDIKDHDKVNKATEYFAEIVAAYLSDNYDRLPEADKEIVRYLLKKLDPGFDRLAALTRRKAIITRMKQKMLEKKQKAPMVLANAK